MSQKNLQISVGQFSSRGRKPVNQDFHGCYIPDGSALNTKGVAVAIADGISSSTVSQIASATAVKSFFSDYYCTSDTWSVKQSASRVLSATNAWLYAQTRNGPYRYDRNKGYVCTFSAIVFKSTSAYLFHSGDTRVYRIADDSLEQLTSDHRSIGEGDAHNLTRALGMAPSLEMEYRAIAVSEGECFLLASDGAYEYLDVAGLIAALQDPEADLQELARTLVEGAFQAGSDDNITAQIVRVDALPDNLPESRQALAESLPIPPTLVPRQIFDGFEILREIYISSRSHVYLARDTDTGQKVVIKTPSGEMRDNRDHLDSLLMEDWIARRINNVHVLRAVVPARKRRYLYSVTEYIEGKTLAQWIIDNPAPDLDAVRTIINQVASGLQALHRQEMVHQDLRPANIMIDSSGTAIIIDFGAVRVAGVAEIAAQNEGVKGTAQFTAPECFLGETASARSDIFSLGVITYQMLCGRLPYGAAVSRSNTPRAQQRLRYRSLRDFNRSIPGWVDHAVAMATRIQPHKRYAEVAEFVHDLKRPASEYRDNNRLPLAERDPVLFWQGVSALMLCLLIFSQLR